MVDVLAVPALSVCHWLRNFLHFKSHGSIWTCLVLLGKLHGNSLAGKLNRVAICNFTIPLRNFKILEILPVKEKLHSHWLTVQTQVCFNYVHTVFYVHILSSIDLIFSLLFYLGCLCFCPSWYQVNHIPYKYIQKQSHCQKFLNSNQCN